MKKNTIRRRQISEDCWHLDYSFLKWLQERLPVYLNEAGKIVDLDFHKFTYKDNEYTQKQMIEKLIVLVNDAAKYNLWDDEYLPTVDEILEIWKLIFHSMWW